ncbi:MAG: hypothetical protein AABZ39_04750 [Spirochaetota bacterium]
MKNKKFQEAIDHWLQIKQDSAFIEKAQSSIVLAQKLLDEGRQKKLQEDRERRKVLSGIKEKFVNTIVFWSEFAVGAASIILKVIRPSF